MDIIIFIVMVLVILLAIIHLQAWQREQRIMASVNLRAAGVMVVCFTVLAVMVFGMRLFLRPDVVVTYRDTYQDVSSNVTIDKDASHVIETKKLQTCDVSFAKSFPLFVVVGRNTQLNRYKMPCDALTAEMKGDISTSLGYLKEESRNAE